ncbi:MAG: nitroreductase, partial [Lentisphaeria bacterium]
QWEQVLSSGAACQNILVASQALGFGAQWLTEWYSYDPHVEAILNMRDKEKIAGFVYIGSYTGAPSERPRPSLEERITFWPQG